MAKTNKKMSNEELVKLREERNAKAKKEMPWIFVRIISAVVLLAIYFMNKYQIDKAYQIFDLTKNVQTIVLAVISIVVFIISILKCAQIELKEKNLSITSKTVREERNVLKLESKAVRFVDFAKGKSWFLLLLSVGILIPSVVGITIYALATVTMSILANNKKFKQMDIALNIVIVGMISVIMRTILI